MMFKNATPYQLGDEVTAAALTPHIENERFLPCGATQQKSVGFVSPRFPDGIGALAETVGGQIIAMFAIETKSVPADALRKAVDAECDRIEKEQGRKPGKKERRDIKDDKLLELLPQAFPRRTLIPLWFRPEQKMLVVGSATQVKVDDVVNALVRCEAVKTIKPLPTRFSPQAWMAECIKHAEINNRVLYIGRDCDLKGSGDEPATVKFRGCDVFADDVERRVQEGQLPSAMRFETSRCAFTLTQTFMLKRIEWLDGAGTADPVEEVDRFDAQVVIETAAIGEAVDALVEAMGGAV